MMKFQALLLLAALFIGAASATRRELRGGDDDGHSHGGRGGGRGGRGGKTIPIGYTTLIRSGQAINQGDAPLGGQIAKDGSAIDLQLKRGSAFGRISDPADTCNTTTTGGPNCTVSTYFRVPQQEVSQNPDYTSILTVGRKLYSFVHFEAVVPSTVYFLELEQDPQNGALKVVQQMPVDWSEWGGLWLPCAGSVTPWGTHLGSEEYEPDARFNQEATSLDGPEATSLAKIDAEGYDRLVQFVRYFGLYYGNYTMEKTRTVFNPYRYGYITELRASKGFRYDNVKHYSMGRLAHEMGNVMPDRRTVYMTDDGTNTGLWKFIADKKNDVSSGSLYGAKITQAGAAGSVGNAATTPFTIEWVLLGRTNQRQVEAIIDSGIKFLDIFDYVKPNTTAPFCPTGYTSINAGQADAKHECLKLKDGTARTKIAAAFLETRRYGAMLGVTVEWSKLEGMVYNEERSTLAFAASDVRYGMESNARAAVNTTRYDIGGPNDIRLVYNPCGCVYEIALTRNYDSSKITPLICGTPSTAVAGNQCDVDGIANPDNLALFPDQNILIIGEDTATHQNDMIWAYNYDTKDITRIATSPYGSEYTSNDYYELGNYAYMTAVVQHPYGESDETKVLDPESTGRAGVVGYIGPMPLKDIRGRGLTFAEIPYAKTNAEKHNIRVSPTVTTS
jgi:hypothetical protein